MDIKEVSMENLWGKIAKARGVELDEEFLFSWNNFTYKYRIRESGLEYFDKGQWYNSLLAIEFIRGEGKIEKVPFRPQKGDWYYTLYLNKEVIDSEWVDNSVDYARLIAGIVFRTEQEARAYIPTWQERISKL